MDDDRAQDVSVRRWHVVAAAFLIALVGLLAGAVRDGQPFRIIPASDRSADAPHIAKRDPARAPAILERRDSSGLHVGGFDGAIAASGISVPGCGLSRTITLSPSVDLRRPAYWPAMLPRAPPLAA